MGDVSGFTEDELLEMVRRVLSGPAPGVVLGPGDDAALVEPGRHLGVLTVDLLVEGVDFDRSSYTARDVGYKAVAVNVSDVAAMGASPRYGLVAVGLPPSVDARWAVELVAGMRAAADEYGLALVGGDLSRASEVTVAVTLTGEVPEGGAVTRAGARPGDRVVVTGALGAAAGGLLLLRAPASSVAAVVASSWARRLVEAQLRPRARVGEGRTLASAGATAMIDVSDGFAKDLSRLCAASGVGATVRLADLPLAAELGELSRHVPAEPLGLALGGGEDFELLAALPAEGVAKARTVLLERFGTPLADVGEIREGSGLVAIDEDGAERPLEPRGWDHFAG